MAGSGPPEMSRVDLCALRNVHGGKLPSDFGSRTSVSIASQALAETVMPESLAVFGCFRQFHEVGETCDVSSNMFALSQTGKDSCRVLCFSCKWGGGGGRAMIPLVLFGVSCEGPR